MPVEPQLARAFNAAPEEPCDDCCYLTSIPLPAFNFFGTDYSLASGMSAYICANGYMMFGQSSSAWYGFSAVFPGAGLFFGAADRFLISVNASDAQQSADGSVDFVTYVLQYGCGPAAGCCLRQCSSSRSGGVLYQRICLHDCFLSHQDGMLR